VNPDYRQGELEPAEEEGAKNVPPVGLRLQQQERQHLAAAVKIALQAAEVTAEDLIALPPQAFHQGRTPARLRAEEANVVLAQQAQHGLVTLHREFQGPIPRDVRAPLEGGEPPAYENGKGADYQRRRY
jgi:hypothetical protein